MLSYKNNNNKIAFISKADHPRIQFCSCDLDLDLDPMTLIYEHDLNILKMCPHTKNEFRRSRLSNVRALETDRCIITAAFAGGNW